VSEYQYYEFQAVDRPLTAREMRELRSYSTRAHGTPTSFVNDYSWGGFRGDEDAWMEKYFDAFLYLANWGTHVLKLRLPASLLDAKTARSFAQRRQQTSTQQQATAQTDGVRGAVHDEAQWKQRVVLENGVGPKARKDSLILGLTANRPDFAR
jgi:hypothetical protein